MDSPYWYIDKQYKKLVKDNQRKIKKKFKKKKKIKLLNTCLGLAGETGEVVDIIKKYMHNGELNKEHLIEELGDVEYYLQSLRNNLNISRDEVIRKNKEKLKG